MDNTISTALKQGGPSAVVLVALLIFWADLNGDFQTLDEGLDELRAEMIKGDQAIRAEMAEEFKAVRADISALGERMARVESWLDSIEGRLNIIEGRLYVDTARPPM